MTSTGFTSSNLCMDLLLRSLQTILSLATMSFRSCCRSLKNSFNFFFGTWGVGKTSYNKLKPDLLSMAVRADASTTILLCKRKGRPRIIGAQRPRATIARMDLDDQRAERSCNCSVMYLENEISTFCPLFSIASSAEKGFRSGLRRRPSLFTYDSRIKTEEEP